MNKPKHIPAIKRGKNRCNYSHLFCQIGIVNQFANLEKPKKTWYISWFNFTKRKKTLCFMIIYFFWYDLILDAFSRRKWHFHSQMQELIHQFHAYMLNFDIGLLINNAHKNSSSHQKSRCKWFHPKDPTLRVIKVVHYIWTSAMGKKAIVGNCTGLFGNVTRLYANVEAHGELCTVEVFLGSDDQHDAAAVLRLTCIFMFSFC